MSKPIFDSPTPDIFPDLSSFKTLVRSDGTYCLGAGLLSDGLIVPIFLDQVSAQAVLDGLAETSPELELSIAGLGDPFKAMRKGAGEGAAGFQVSGETCDDHRKRLVAERTAGRVLFPFLVRISEAGSQWPTVLGSALLCDTGVYLTRRGAVQFGPHDLKQWKRWDVMDMGQCPDVPGAALPLARSRRAVLVPGAQSGQGELQEGRQLVRDGRPRRRAVRERSRNAAIHASRGVLPCFHV